MLARACHRTRIGAWEIYWFIATSPDKAERAQAGLLEHIELACAAPPAAAELERARQFLAGNHEIGMQRNSSRASVIALDVLYGLECDSYRKYREDISAISPEQVWAVAQRILRLDRCALVAVGPDASTFT